MPPGRKPTHSPEEFVDSAVAFADEHGLDALTLRGLGQAMGVSATAIYRYFADKDALIIAMRETLLTQVLSKEPSGTPEQALADIGLAYRRVAREHPCLSQIMIVGVNQGDLALAVPQVIATYLEAMGMHGREVAVAYRQLESFVVGTSYFDFADAPRHLTERLERMHRTGVSDVAYGLDSATDVDRMNEEAYERTLRIIIASFRARHIGES
jgi:AcrR family transcriptional regulator